MYAIFNDVRQGHVEQLVAQIRLERLCLLLIVVVLPACAGTQFSAQDPADTPTPNLNQDDNSTGISLPGNLDSVTFIEDNTEYTIRQLLPRDGILPVYNPHFVSAGESNYRDDELVMGLEINGDARAYSVGMLRSREMVNDEVGGTPVLVTW